MNVQYLSNEEGKRVAVQISMEEWEDMQIRLKKSSFLDSFTQAVKELKMMRDGKLSKPDINDLFND
ncbi:hypothetical protein [Dyadobacter sp. MSC1_007]|jgi:hypothetical protein|uniref:hypothetical protein n=1 Tax=Dyadobacter sp. MSC1_007 TaxID=2909264 RepID=UPI00202EEA69|nr:hypothetical protein [Dyadobacter sp. MSC1_007]